MLSIKDSLEQIISENMFLEDALYHDYLNLSAFGAYILPMVEKLTKKEVSLGAIKMALSRISKEKQKTVKYKRITGDNIFIKKNINILSLDNSSDSNNFLNKMYSLNISKERSYFGITHGIEETDIIYSQNLEGQIFKIVDKHNLDVKLKMTDLGAIGIYLDEELLRTSGVIYNLTKKMAFFNINIVAILSTYTEIAFILDKNDLKKAFDVLVVW